MLFKPSKMIPVVKARERLEQIIEDILERFDIGRESFIEFGYSSVFFFLKK